MNPNLKLSIQLKHSKSERMRGDEIWLHVYRVALVFKMIQEGVYIILQIK